MELQQPPERPEWLNPFAERVNHALCMYDGEVIRPTGFESIYLTAEDDHALMFRPAMGEVFGGPNDGTVECGPLELDVLAIANCFDKCKEVAYSSRHDPKSQEVGGRRHICFSGLFRGRTVAVFIFDEPDIEQAPSVVIDTLRQAVRIKE